MKTKAVLKLKVSRETVRALHDRNLAEAAGGSYKVGGTVGPGCCTQTVTAYSKCQGC